LEACAQKRVHISRDELNEVVAQCNKRRFAFDETGTRIRANQGHSVEIELQLEPHEPPAELFHGTAERYVPAILTQGLLRMNRHHVHLSSDIATARQVGQRHGKSVILVVNAMAMYHAHYLFYQSANGVWLVDHVPTVYLRLFS
jgi:putative RNA 2'-phosphotransferase